ncbi:MAG: PEP-CTERM sorting domain-containing protein [Planctomycetota bacterium]
MIRTAALIALAGASSLASAQTLDFSGLVHGEVVNNQFAGAGVTVSAVNPNRSFDLAVAFDTTMSGTADPDLEDPFVTGNIDGNTFLGNVLILQENDTDADGDGILDNPDDEGSRPAGQLIFDFDTTIASLGFDIVDLEGSIAENSVIEFFLGGSSVLSIDFAEFEAGGAFDMGAIFGNNTLNRIDEISVAGGFDRAVFNLGGSSAIDNVAFTVPAPGAVALLGLGGLAAARRRR